MKPPTIGNSVCAELLRKFPDAPSLTVAKIAYRDNPAVFNSLDSARNIIRYLRGASGTHNRRGMAPNEFVREPGSPSASPFESIREGEVELADWKPLQLDGPASVLVIADSHIPFHDRSALIAALKWGRDNGADTVVLNGDILDFFSVSFWEKDPRRRDMRHELEIGQEFFTALRDGFRKARIIFKVGNHEERWIRYMRVKAPELLDIADFNLCNVLKLDSHGIEAVEDKRPIRLGRLNVLHGHEYRFAISNPVNAARGLFLRCKAYALCAHFHQKSEHSENTVEGNSVATWSTGCLCQSHPEYAPLNNWVHGFAHVEVARDGKFAVRNFKIGEGGVY